MHLCTIFKYTQYICTYININIYRNVILNCLIKCGITKLDVATEQVHATTMHKQCGNAMVCVITMELRNAPHSIPPAGAAAAAAQTGICCSRTFQHCNTLTHYSPLASAFWSSNIKGRVTEIIKQSSYQKQTQGQTFLSSFTLKETLAPIDRTPGIPGSDKNWFVEIFLDLYYKSKKYPQINFLLLLKMFNQQEELHILVVDFFFLELLVVFSTLNQVSEF